MWSRLRSYVMPWLAALILSYCVFAAAMPTFGVFVAVLCMAEMLILLVYGRPANHALLSRVFWMEAGCLSAFTLQWWLLGREILCSDLNKKERGLSIAAFAGTVIIFAFASVGACADTIKKKKKARTENQARRLFPEREHDLQRLEDFLSKGAPLIGVDAQWGEGKTFLLDRLCERRKSDSEIVRVNVLAGHEDELETSLMNEFDRILRRNRVFSHSSRQILKILGSNDLLKQLGSLFMKDTDSVEETFDGVLRDLEKIKKNVLIIVDDVERLADDKQIRKLFALMEGVSSPKLQIIYLYNRQRLSDKFDRDYLEKYIPYYMALTPISFQSIVRQFWPELEMDTTQLKRDDVEKLIDFPDISYSIMRILAVDGMNNVRGFRLDNIRVRRVRIFLEEFRNLTTPTANAEGTAVFARSEDERKLLLKCLFIKHFLPEVFEQFTLQNEIAERVLFRLDEKAMSMLEPLNMTKRANVTLPYLFEVRRQLRSYDDMREFMNGVLSVADNYNRLVALSMLGFDYIDLLRQIERDEQGRVKKSQPAAGKGFDPLITRGEQFGNADMSQIRRERDNEHINRVMWNLIANGSSERADLDAYAYHFQKTVLDAVPEARDQAWNAFSSDAYHTNIYKDNQTCERIGVDPFLPIFQGFRVTNASAQRWLDLFDFYFSRPGQKNISVEMVQNLNYADILNHLVYISLLQHFMSRKIVGNLNAEPCFYRFLNNTLRMAASLGYASGYAFDGLQYDMYGNPDEIMDENDLLPSEQWEGRVRELYCQFPILKDELKSGLLKDKKMWWFNDDIQIIIDFIDFCGELINAESPLKMRGGPHIEIGDVTTRSRHQDAVDELEAMRRLTEANILPYQEIRNAYENGKLDPIEVRELAKPALENDMKEKTEEQPASV